MLPLFQLVCTENHLHVSNAVSHVYPGAGVIGDITTSAERGSLIGIFGGGEQILKPYPPFA